MTYVTCQCGVRLLYVRAAQGPEQHWSKADIKACQLQDAEKGVEPQCPRIDQLVNDDFADWQRRMNGLRRTPRIAQDVLVDSIASSEAARFGICG
jgi:hypothetical protein